MKELSGTGREFLFTQLERNESAKMIELTSWWGATPFLPRDWLILGKGPTLADYQPDCGEHYTLGLNHVVNVLKVDVAHAIDIEVIGDCEDDLYENCRFLVMPYVPNVKGGNGRVPLSEYFSILPVLKRLSNEGRLVWYNLKSCGGERPHPFVLSPAISAKYFSIEAALTILAELGVKKIRSFGIDGGASYSASLKHLESKTLLVNGQKSFDIQFGEIQRIVDTYKLDYAPMTEPMHVFVGTDDSQMVAAKVLEHSIKECSSRPVKVTHMRNLRYPAITNPSVKPGTGFSFSRFMIPALMGYRGRALYCDADMQVFGDLAELWDIPFGEQTVLCTRQDYIPDIWKGNPAFTPGRQLSVMLLDCDRLSWRIEDIIAGLNSGEFSYKQLMTELCLVPPAQIRDDLPAGWNCLEHFEQGVSRLVHYTNVPSQPWKVDSNPLNELWLGGLRSAIAEGAVTVELMSEGVLGGHVRRGLLEEFPHYTSGSVNDCEDPLQNCRQLLWTTLAELRDKDVRIEELQTKLNSAQSYRERSLRGLLSRGMRKIRRMVN